MERLDLGLRRTDTFEEKRRGKGEDSTKKERRKEKARHSD